MSSRAYKGGIEIFHKKRKLTLEIYFLPLYEPAFPAIAYYKPTDHFTSFKLQNL